MATTWTFERIVSVLNLGAILAGAVFAAIEFGPQLTVARGQAVASQQTPTNPSGHLNVDDIKSCNDGSHLYRLVYDVGTINASLYPIHITYSIEAINIGDIDIPTLALHHIYIINDSPTPFARASPGQISWNRITFDVHDVISDMSRIVHDTLHSRYADVSDDGALTGPIAPGSSTESAIPFVFRARRGEYLVVSYIYGLDNHIGPDNSGGGEVDEI